jgi:hypothetical protein
MAELTWQALLAPLPDAAPKIRPVAPPEFRHESIGG